VLRHWNARPLDDLLAASGLSGLPEEDFPNDGWSGARLTRIRRGSESFVLKRTSWARDWICRATRDRAVREAFVASGQVALPGQVVAPYLGAAADGMEAAILMPDLSGTLIAWDSAAEGAIDVTTLDQVLGAMAALHARPWATTLDAAGDWPWCPLRERLELLTRPSAERYRAEGLAVGQRFLAGWEAFERRAAPEAVDLIHRLTADTDPLLDALAELPSADLHGDLKLANVGPMPEGRVAIIDWQMAIRAPVAVELGWFLVSNVASLPEPSDAILERYRKAADDAGVDLGDWDAQRDLAWLTGLLLRGWRKGLDAASGTPTGWGASAADDLAWWGRQAVAAANRLGA
jgi:aminoglycoside phosphotransferase (APT) family kinase protein